MGICMRWYRIRVELWVCGCNERDRCEDGYGGGKMKDMFNGYGKSVSENDGQKSEYAGEKRMESMGMVE